MSPTSQLPINSSLFIATPGAIQAYSRSGQKPLCECATDGIVNARAAKDNSSLIAVADSHLVILHDSARGHDRKYRLNNGEGEPRLLLFSPDSRTLYFTTTLSTAIQAYCIPTGELLPPPQIHPSPPNILTISDDGNILLSASSSPPTIFIQDLRVGGSAAVNVHPTHASSPAVFAAFSSSDEYAVSASTTFVLGFQDGTLCLYRLSTPTRRPSYVDAHLNQGQTFHLQQTKIGSIRRLHKAAMGGITAAEFLPGYKSRVVSIGHDGRCPATCLSVMTSAPMMSRGRRDRAVLIGGDSTHDEPVYRGRETFIAVGTQAGRVMVFNVLGLLVHEVEMNASIVALEWIGDLSAPSVLHNRRNSMPPLFFTERAPSVLDALLDKSNSSSEDEEDGTVKRTRSPTRHVVPRSPIRLDGVRDLFSPELQDHLRMIRKPSDVSNGSPLQIDRTRNPVRRKSFRRPRLATETFKS
ncbi:hypothetical protein P280DRAFT_424235, partial [Massarina eburnea CBS 473.64]